MLNTDDYWPQPNCSKTPMSRDPTDNTFTELLGKDPAERYRIIMDEASHVDDLDI